MLERTLKGTPLRKREAEIKQMETIPMLGKIDSKTIFFKKGKKIDIFIGRYSTREILQFLTNIQKTLPLTISKNKHCLGVKAQNILV